MKIIGYKFEIVRENGDVDEWYRQEHIESPVYTSLDVVKTSMALAKKKMLCEVKRRKEKYIAEQIDFEISNGRNVNLFLCDCQIGLMCEYKRVLKLFSSAKIIPVFAYEEPTDEYEMFNIAD